MMTTSDPNHPKRKFWAQRQSARRRKIEWKLTFEEWWDIWDKSGYWEQRGVRNGQYCMSRIGDIGPYKIGNVFIQKHSQNSSDGNRGRLLGIKLSKDQLSKIRPSGRRPKLTQQQVDDILNQFNQIKPFPFGTKMKWLTAISQKYNITVSLADKITNGRCARWYN